MAKSRSAGPSPVRSAIVHTGLSFAVFGGIVGVMGAGIQMTGNPDRAGPREIIALFETHDTGTPALKARIDDRDYQLTSLQPQTQAARPDRAEPLLDVPDPGQAEFRQTTRTSPVESVRINGRTVQPGQSLSQVTQSESQINETSPAETPQPVFASVSSNDLYAATVSGRAPIITSDGRSVAESYARPFSNPEGRPTVSVIVRGLGKSRRYTNAAIDELPPEITLSFVANANGLRNLVRRAHEAGHEVLIEVPMEPLEDGRRAPPPNRLNTGQSASETATRLEWQLARTKGYFGVLNYQGAKFATEAASVKPLMAELARRGVAFIEDGSLPNSVFADVAGTTDTRFAKADLVIDTRRDAAEIETQLLTLESLALENGHALGTGFTYPVTLDTVKAWVGRLEAKGIMLAPASHVIRQNQARQVPGSEVFQTGMFEEGLSGQDG